MSDFPTFVQINEEGPREGFQFEKGPISTERKIELIDALSETGLNHIQVASFVNPNRVPGWADADQVVRGFKRHEGVHYAPLWLNAKGFQRALTFDGLEIKGSLSLCASAKFLARNQQRSMEENLAAQHEMIHLFKAANVPIERGSIMAAFGCNFEGDIAHETVLALLQQMLDVAAEHGLNIKILSLADTMAWATPVAVTAGRTSGSRCTCTTPAAWASPTPMPACRWGWTSSTARSLVSAAAHLPRTRARPAMSAPRIWSSCVRKWASRPASIWKSCWKPPAWRKTSSAIRCPARSRWAAA